MVDLFRRTGKRGGAETTGIDATLDLDFYRSYYADLAAHDDKAAALHWRLHGRNENRAPNARAALRSHPNFARLPERFDPLDYVFLNRDLPRSYANALAATLHYLDYGLAEGRGWGPVDADAGFLAAYARAVPSKPSRLEEADPRLRWLPKRAEQFLYLHGFADAGFLDHLDVDFYSFTNGLSRTDAPRTREACVFHLAEAGVAGLRPIAEHLRFDPDFHRQTLRAAGLAEAAALPDPDLYRRWLGENRFESFPPNRLARLRRRFGVTCGPRVPIDLATYRQANRDLQGLEDARLLEHVFAHGFEEKRSALRIDPSNVGLFTAYARHLEDRESYAEAEAVYLRLAHFLPNEAAPNGRLGDYLMEGERFAEAFACFRRVIEGGAASTVTYLKASACCEKLGDRRTAVSLLAEGARAAPDDQHIRGVRDTAARRFFDDEFAYARAMALGGRIADGQRVAAQAAALCDFGAGSTAPARPIRTVAVFANMDLPQCTLYRVEQKAEQLAAAGFAVRVYDWLADGTRFERDLADCDAAIFFRVAAFPSVTRAINAARAAGVVTFYDIDDLVFDPAEFPEPFADYAGQITPSEYVDVAMGVPLFRHALSLCDYAIASTPALARRMEPLVRGKRAFVHRNALGRRHERAMARPREPAPAGRPVTLFYGSGTKAHKLDFETILLPALEEIDRRFGAGVRIVIAGYRPASVKSGIFERVHFAPFTPEIEDYWALLAEADVNLSVLRRTPVTDVKSEIKWLEAAMLGIPSVVSATDTFDGVITDGVDGFVAASTADFVDRISLLVRDGGRREQVGEAARAAALGRYGLAALAANLRDTFAAAVPPRPERTRVLVVNVFYPPQAKGGATRVVADNVSDIRELHPDGFDFEVFTTLEGGPETYAVEVSSFDGVRTTAVTAGNYPDVDRAAQDGRMEALFSACVERFAPHLIHFHCIQRMGASLADVARRAAIPYLITVHDGWWISDSQFLYDARGPAPRYDFAQPLRSRGGKNRGAFDRAARLLPALRNAAAILAVSEPFAAVYRATGLDVRAVANGLPRVSTDRADQSRAAEAGRTRVRIAHLGGTEVHKGFPLLKYAVHAAAPANIDVLAVELAMAPGEERFEDWNGTPARIVARRPQSEVAGLYREIDVLFAPSLWPESFGLVTREALAAGCWVVASDRGAVGEPVADGVNGHVISVDTIDGLVAVIKRIDADPARYTAPPPPPAPMRTSRDQARDLVAIYRELAPNPREAAEAR